MLVEYNHLGMRYNSHKSTNTKLYDHITPPCTVPQVACVQSEMFAKYNNLIRNLLPKDDAMALELNKFSAIFC